MVPWLQQEYYRNWRIPSTKEHPWQHMLCSAESILQAFLQHLSCNAGMLWRSYKEHSDVRMPAGSAVLFAGYGQLLTLTLGWSACVQAGLSCISCRMEHSSQKVSASAWLPKLPLRLRSLYIVLFLMKWSRVGLGVCHTWKDLPICAFTVPCRKQLN